MASSRIKGITIEIGGDTTKLVSALSKVDSAISKTQTNLRDINKALKFDSTNTELLRDKQVELANAISETEEKLQAEKEAFEQMKNADGFDENSEAARNLKTQIDLDTAALKELEAEAKASCSVLGTQMQVAGEKIQEVGSKIKSVGDAISSIGTKLTTTVTVPLVAAGTKAVQTFAEVDKTMQLTNATMGNTTEEAEALDEAMKSAASNSTFTMDDAATATLNFARAGLSATEAANALAPAMNLAAGEGGTLDTVSSGLVATINGFGDTFDNAAAYADVFAAACNNSALDIDSLSEAFSVAAPIFSAAGYTVNDAALYMGTMANAGIEANEAATSLKTGLARLVSPAADGATAMEELGITVTNADGSMKDSITIQKELHDTFAQLSESEQIAAASAIFGKNQMSNWLALINTAPEDVQSLALELDGAGLSIDDFADKLADSGLSIDDMRTEMESLGVSQSAFENALKASGGDAELFAELLHEATDGGTSFEDVVDALGGDLTTLQGVMDNTNGTTQTMADTMMSGFGGSLEKLSSSINVAVYSLGQALAPTISIVAEKIQELVDWFNSLDAEQQSQIAQWLMIAAAVGPVILIIGKVVTVISGVVSAIGAVVSAIGTALTVVKGIGLAITAATGPIGLIVIAIAALVAGIIYLWNNCEGFRNAVIEIATTVWTKIQETIATAITLIQGFATTIQAAWTEMLANIVAFLSSVKQTFTTIWTNIKTTVTTIVTNIKTTIQNIWNAIKTWLFTTLSTILSKFKAIFDSIKSAVSEKITQVKETIVSGIQAACDFISGLPSKFFDWGKDMISSLIDGIKSMLSGLVDAASNVAETIASYIHFSVPDKGPLADADEYMPDFMDLLVSGINSSLPRIESAMNGLAATMTPNLTTGGGVANNTVNITVYGAEGQDVTELADIIQDRINTQIYIKGATYA